MFMLYGCIDSSLPPGGEEQMQGFGLQVGIAKDMGRKLSRMSAAVTGMLLLTYVSLPGAKSILAAEIPVNDPNVAYSPYNWYVNGSTYAQTPNPGAYCKLGFTGTSLRINFDVSPESAHAIKAAQYPLIRYSVDDGPSTSVQLTPTTTSITAGSGLSSGNHSLLIQYVAGYVFLDFWTPVNAVRITGFTVDDGASTVQPTGWIAVKPKSILFLGDSITNGDNTTANFVDGVTNAVPTQDATQCYTEPIAAAIGAEYGVVAYGGASFDSNAADGHTPGLTTFFDRLDSQHSRLAAGRFSPVPSDIFINMGENSGPGIGDVGKLLKSLRADSSASTNIWIIIPFSGRQRSQLEAGTAAYQSSNASDKHVHILDTGDCPYLSDNGRTSVSVDGQHPLAQLDALLGAELTEARQIALSAPGGKGRRF